MLLAVEREVAEDLSHALAEATDLNEFCFDREEKSAAYEEDDEDVVGKICVDFLYDVKKSLHIYAFLSRDFFRKQRKYRDSRSVEYLLHSFA